MNKYKEFNENLEDIFDLNYTAKLYALYDIGKIRHSYHWHNQRFYYNPKENKLEHIAFDCYAGIEEGIDDNFNGFEDLDVRKRFNDKPSHDLHIYVTSHPNTLATSDAVKSWMEDVRLRLPPGVELYLWRDSADLFKGRANTLVKNGVGGLVLVFLLLMLFLHKKLYELILKQPLIRKILTVKKLKKNLDGLQI